jgi:single-strand DNA-binding protein
MARGVNKVILIGNCGGDPEVRYMPSGGAVTNLTLATTDNWLDKQSNQRQERTEWHRLVFFNRLAEIVGEYVRKGSKLYVEGSLRTRQWEQDGTKRYTTEIVVSEMQMLDSRGEGQAYRGGSTHQQQPAPAAHQTNQFSQSPSAGHSSTKPAKQEPAAQQNPSGAQSFDSFDDDIPF